MYLDILTNTITTALATIILLIYFSIFFEKNPTHKRKHWLWFLYIVWQFLFMNLPEVPSYLKLFVNISFIMILCSYYFIGPIFSQMIVSVLICSIWTLFEFLVGSFFILFDLQLKLEQMVGSILSKLLTLLLIIILRKFFKNEKMSKLPAGYYILMTLLPVGSLYLVFNIFNLCSENQKTSAWWISIFSLIIILIINLVIFKIYMLLTKEFEIRHQNLIYVQQLNAFEKYNAERETMETAFKKAKHDFRHHHTILYELLKKEEYGKAQEYIESLNTNLRAMDNTMVRTGNIIIDSLLNSKFSMLSRSDWELVIDIHIPSRLPFEVADLGITFGNIIDNAIEAVSQLDDSTKSIKLFARYEAGILIITCINTFSGQILLSPGGELITLKEDTSTHGFGIHSVKAVANKYHGSLSTEFTDHIFKIKVLLCAP